MPMEDYEDSLMFSPDFGRGDSELWPDAAREQLAAYENEIAAAEAAIDKLIREGRTARRECQELPVLRTGTIG